jgi:hypothetical protein
MITGSQVTAAICVYLRARGASPPSPTGAVLETLARATTIQTSPNPEGTLGRLEPWPFVRLDELELQVLVECYASPVITPTGVDQQTGRTVSTIRRPYDWELAKRMRVSIDHARRLLSSAREKVREALERAEAVSERNHERKCE